ncbi:MAG TPA: CheR family methyltransferase [Pirellulales bacterium]|jgi:chemotaxis protein methyltransferase CheR|nr:CheR family methyltransferase [Pirellulales bacterium]
MKPLAHQSLPLSESVFVILRDLIQERIGLHYTLDKREALADRLAGRVADRQFSSFLDYYYCLKYDADNGQEWRYVHDALAIPETYFWREMDQIHALVDRLVPQHFSAFPDQPLRIWSASCATGEEPLTIAMALAEAGWQGAPAIEIWASDASPVAIAAARRGIYRERSFRNLPNELRKRYFIEEEGGSRIIPELHDRVQWAEVNLMDRASVWPLANASIIFCRNTFIYFAPEATEITVRLFAEAMPTPGYLFVGVSESLLKLTTDFELREIDQAFVYVKTATPAR